MTSKDIARRACLLVLPLAAIALSGVFNRLRAPFFLWADPDYTYLLSALCIAEGAAPGHIDHPGTPLQAFGALMLYARHLAAGRPFGSLREHVLREPELFLAFWREVLRGLYMLALAAGGGLVLRVTRSLAAALLFQMLPLASSVVVLALSRVATEAALLVLGTTLSALTLAATLDPARWGGTRTAAALGVLGGLGVATKVVFAPCALVPWAALDRRGRRVFALAGAGALAVGVLPIATQLPDAVRLYWRMATRTRLYGHGPVGLVDTTRLAGSAASLLREEWLTLAVIVMAVGVGTAVLRRGPAEHVRAARVLVATGALQAAWIAIVLKHFAPNYLVPAALLNGLQVGLAWHLGPHLPRAAFVASRAGFAALLCAAVALSPSRLSEAARSHQRITAGHAEAARALASAQPAIEDSFWLSQAGALQHGNVYARGRFHVNLRELYPAFVSWDGNGAQAFGEPLPLGPLLRARADGGPSVFAMVGKHSQVLLAPPAGLELEVRERFLDHVLYEVRLRPCVSGVRDFEELRLSCPATPPSP